MKDWLISIGLLVLLISLLTIILPDGKVGKYVKSIFSILVLLTVLKPLINIKNSSFDINFFDNETTVYYQEDYLYYFYEKQKKSIEENCIKLIQDEGIKSATVNVEYVIDDLSFKVTNVKINLSNAVINSNKEHIFVIEDVKQSLINYLNVDEKQLVIYE